jgi:hypothetical protein
MLRPRGGQEDDAGKRIAIEQVGAEVRSRSLQGFTTQPLNLEFEDLNNTTLQK